jgi:hypothetical protein
MIKQGIYFERLSKKAQSPSRGSFLIQMTVGKRGNEHHGGRDALPAKLAQQLKATDSGHVNVGNDAVQAKSVRGNQERFGRRERLGAIAHGTHQIDQGRAERLIVVDNCNERDRHRS